MNREFLDLYNRELLLLYEQAQDFANEYPGIAERLGGLVGSRSDPMIGGLLEGTAFLAARVQLKIKHEFPEFTTNLLEQLVPNYLAPTPSVLLAKFGAPYGDPALRDGQRIARGSYLDATYLERERRVACRYRLNTDVTLWPFELTAAEYVASIAPLQALGLPLGAEVVAGLKLSLAGRTAASAEDEVSDEQAAKQPDLWLSACRAKDLPIHMVGGQADAVALYEQIFANCVGLFFRYVDGSGTPVVLRAPQDSIQPVGFDEDEALLPNDKRIFRGYDLLREYFMFPRKFLGFRLANLGQILPKLNARCVDVLFAFRESHARLGAAVKRSTFALYAAPAVNLFEKTTDRVPIRTSQHEFHVVPDRSRSLDFEPHRILDVHAHYAGRQDKVPVQPLYSARDGASAEAGLHYTVRRVPRRRTTDERRFGTSSDYVGTDMFLAITEPAGIRDEPAVKELSVRALCSNRHLTEHLPVGEGGADFHLLDDTSLGIECVDGPTRPREPVVTQLRGRNETAHTGTVAWRLINMLSLNHLGLVDHAAGKDASALKEALALFADPTDSTSERQIKGLRSVDSRPVVRRIRQRSGVGAARGIEVTVTMDEKAFEGSGVFLLGAILDRFFAEYAGINHFTQTAIRTVERGEIMRWPPRIGRREPL